MLKKVTANVSMRSGKILEFILDYSVTWSEALHKKNRLSLEVSRKYVNNTLIQLKSKYSIEGNI